VTALDAPAVREVFGISDDYPLPIGTGEAAPLGFWCQDGIPVTTPDSTFMASRNFFSPTLTELSSFNILGVPQFPRGWYSTVTLNRAARVTMANVTSRPLNGVLTVWGYQIIDFNAVDRLGALGYQAQYQIKVTEFANGAATPTAGYAGLARDANIFFARPTLEVSHYWNVEVDYKFTIQDRVVGILPSLPPGRSFAFEPNIWVHELSGTTQDPPFSGTADTGIYTAAGMHFAIALWSDMSGD